MRALPILRAINILLLVSVWSIKGEANSLHHIAARGCRQNAWFSMIMRRLCISYRPSPSQTLSRSSSRWAGLSEWTSKKLQSLLASSEQARVTSSPSPSPPLARGQEDEVRRKKKKQKVVDAKPVAKEGSSSPRLPDWLEDWRAEFPQESAYERRRRKLESSRRIAKIAADRVLEPSAIALLGASASVVVGIGAVEATLMCTELPFVSFDSTAFVTRYAFEQLLPSCVWSTQDANLVATAMGYDPNILLRSLDPTNAADASSILRIQLMTFVRSMFGGFMLLAQLVRVGAIGAAAPGLYEERIRLGREPPVIPEEGGLIVRMCGVESDTTATSLRRMGRHILPVFELPQAVAPIVAQYSDNGRLPVFWCVQPERYGASYSWQRFPVSSKCLVKTNMGKNVLLLEADATNSDDPLSLGDQALDLTIEDASQGFRRIQELYRSSNALPPFRTFRVFLGNSLELAKSGGGHSYTLRHRIRYAKEVDVLIDSRAPVLREVLSWCERAVTGQDKSVLFQTNNRQYFLSLQLIMKQYGYDIYDPLDWHMLNNDDERQEPIDRDDETEQERKSRSLLQVLVDDRNESDRKGGEDEEQMKLTKSTKQDTLRRLARLSKLPRLVYYGKTAETVNAMQALIHAGEVDGDCCALLDKREGTLSLTNILNEQSDLIQESVMKWRRKKEPTVENEADTSSKQHKGLHIICSSTIYDDLFRQVRQWIRMGYTETQIQKELDIRFQDIIRQSQEVKETVIEVTEEEEIPEVSVKIEGSSSRESKDTQPTVEMSLEEQNHK